MPKTKQPAGATGQRWNLDIEKGCKGMKQQMLKIHEFIMILKKIQWSPLEDTRKPIHYSKTGKWNETSIYPTFPVKITFQVNEIANTPKFYFVEC